MTPSELQAVWAEKITSAEQYNAARIKTRYESDALGSIGASQFAPQSNSIMSANVTTDDTWFLRREASREAVGVYPEPSAVLRWMRANGCAQYFPHVSVKDPTMVAFTPDRQSGLADRQVPTTMGKLLRKFFLVLTDAEVARLEASHRADLDGSFELATTLEAIQAAFVVVGDNSCMRYSKEHWGLADYHPSAVYCAPGMGIAVTRNGSGEVNARTVVWTNPANPEDKRYVRIYGDQALKRRLERAGYRMAGLAGARLAALKDSSSADANDYVMPWIDPAGGIYGSPSDRSLDSDVVVKYKGEDTLRLLTSTESAAYQNAGLSVTSVRQQGGRVRVTEIDPATLTYTCAITGQASDRMEHRTVKWIDDAGVTGQARQDALRYSPTNNTTFYTLNRVGEDGNAEAMYCTKETKEKFGTPGFPSYFNDTLTREYAGIVQLDAALYGENLYAKKRECFAVYGLGYIKKADAMRVFNADGEERYEHVGSVKALRKQGYVATAVLGRIKVMTHTANPALVVTVGSRKVLKGLHDVLEMSDGRWEYSSKVVAWRALASSFYTTKDAAPEAVRLSAEQVEARVGEYLRSSTTQTRLSDRALEYATQQVVTDRRRYPTYLMRDDRLTEKASYQQATLAQVEAAVDRLLTLGSDPVQLAATVGAYSAPGALCWAHITRHVLSIYHDEVAKRAMAAAEANAVEAPHYLGTNDLRFALAA